MRVLPGPQNRKSSSVLLFKSNPFNCMEPAGSMSLFLEECWAYHSDNDGYTGADAAGVTGV